MHRLSVIGYFALRLRGRMAPQAEGVGSAEPKKCFGGWSCGCNYLYRIALRLILGGYDRAALE
jgi:hypothetical protein